MAGVNKIIGYIAGPPVQSTGQSLEIWEFKVCYFVTGSVTGEYSGECQLAVDITQNETQIVNDLKVALAAYVEPRVFPAQGFAAVDVRGLNL